MVWRQHRRVQAGEVDLSSLDLDIKVTKPKDDPLEFSVTAWNLTDETWDRIQDGNLCRIELGWADGDVESVCLGEIDTRTRSPDQNDIQFEISGIDETESAVQVRPDDHDSWSSWTWVNARPDEIVEDIADEIGLAAQTVPAGEEMRQSWAITEDKKISGWLDELAQRAAEDTGVAWEWFAQRGQIYFLPRSEEAEEAPQLSYEGMLLNVGPKSDTNDDVEGQLEFEAMLEPRIAKGAAVYVDVDGHRGAYRVSDYEFQSSTVTGDHLVRGTLTPVDADYSIEG